MQGVHHLGLSVSKLEDTADFFCRCLGWEEVRRDLEYPAIFVSNGSVMFTLWQTQQPSVVFNRKTNVGLHHVALEMDTQQELNQLAEQLRLENNVQIEFEPQLLRNGPAKHMMCTEPSGIRVEFIWAP